MVKGHDSAADEYKLFFKKSSINNLHILIAEEDKIVTGVNAVFKAVTYAFSDIKGSFLFYFF